MLFFFLIPFIYFVLTKPGKLLQWRIHAWPQLLKHTNNAFVKNTYVPSTTFERALLGAKGVANKLFITFLFSDPDVGVHFLKDVGLIRSSMVCCKCGSQTYWCEDTNHRGGYGLLCRRITCVLMLYFRVNQVRFMVLAEYPLFHGGTVLHIQHHSLLSCSHYPSRPSVTLLTSNTSHSWRNETLRDSISYVTVRNTSVPGERTTTDDVPRSFVVLCAPKRPNLRTNVQNPKGVLCTSSNLRIEPSLGWDVLRHSKRYLEFNTRRKLLIFRCFVLVYSSA